VYQSAATNLVAGDLNGKLDVFVRDRLLGVTLRASVLAGGAEGSGDSQRADVASNGRYVAFQSLASEFAPPDVNGVADVFVKDLETGALVCASLDPLGLVGNGASGAPALSADGRFVAFQSAAATLVAGDDNGQFDVFVRDLANGALELVSKSTDGTLGNFGSQAPSISADGRIVAYSSLADNLVPNDSNHVFDVFARHLPLGQTVRVSVSTFGAQAFSSSQSSSITADGRFVVFQSQAWNLVPDDTNGGPLNTFSDVFVRDLAQNQTARLSVSESGQQATGGSSLHACAAPDGSRVAFATDAADLVANDLNGVRDWVVRGCGGAPPPVPFCSGDGTAAPCPCGNAGLPGRGCDNSMATGGARIQASGKASVSDDRLTLLVDGLTPAPSLIVFQGETDLAGGRGVPFGDGLRCAGGEIWRLVIAFASNGVLTHGYGVPGDAPISIAGHVPPGGVHLRVYQAWYRNQADFCTPAFFNLSSAVRVTWVP
jgi:hypothetical protein